MTWVSCVDHIDQRQKKNVGLVTCKPTFIEEIPSGSLICVEFVGLKLSN